MNEFKKYNNLSNNIIHKGYVLPNNKLNIESIFLIDLLNKKIPYLDIIYPTEWIYEEDKLLISLKLKVKLQKQNYKYILDEVLENGDLSIFVFQEKYKKEAIFNIFLLNNRNNILKKDDFKLSFMLQILLMDNYKNLFNFYNESLKRTYIRNELYSKDIKIYLKENKKNVKDKSYHSYIESYDLINKYDNFSDFDKVLKKYTKEAKEYKKKMMNSKEFKEFYKKQEVKDYIFNLSRSVGADNPAYTPKLAKKIHAYRNKELKL